MPDSPNFPNNFDFGEMSKPELRAFLRWWIDEGVPERRAVFPQMVKATPGFETWVADYKPASLDVLGEWFASKVEVRPRTQEEMARISAPLDVRIEVASWELTNLTAALAVDVGIYLSEVFLHNHQELKWDQKLGSRRYIDYGRPLLTGFGRVPFSPIRMMIGLAHGIASGRRTSQGLRKIYDVWSSEIEKPQL